MYADCERGEFDASEWAQPDIEFVFADGPSSLIAPRQGAGRGWTARRTRDDLYLGPTELSRPPRTPAAPPTASITDRMSSIRSSYPGADPT
jgi:hypothetical protein